MGSRLLVSSDRFYRLLLSSYPAEFRGRFAAEMAQVFRLVCQDVVADSGAGGLITFWLSVLWDWIWAALYQWTLVLFKPRREIMPVNFVNQKDDVSPLPFIQAGLAVLPFLLFGLSSILSKLLLSLPLQYSTANWISFSVLTLIPLGLFASLLAGFPRWGYPFLGWTIIILFMYTKNLWPLVIGVILLALLIRRSLQPLRSLLSGLWQDWTMLSFALYILYSFVDMLFDENHNPHLFILIIATILSLSLGAWGYFRSASPLRRVLALVGGLLLSSVISVIPSITWDFAAYFNLPKGYTNVNLVAIYFVILSLIMVGNGVLAYRRSRRNLVSSHFHP